jgi:predicted nucleotidyltransferase
MNQNRINIEFEEVLGLLKGEVHGRALARELKVPLATIQRVLIRLEDKNIVDYKIIGKNKIYFIKKNLAAKLQVYSAEHYKFMKLIEAYPYLGPLFEDIIKKHPNEMIILFGSYAKFSAKKDSDIDIYVDSNSLAIKKAIEGINSKINVKVGKFNKEDLLIKEIIKNHIIIQGVERYYEKLGFFN